jgi:hypothetical protein
MFLSPLLRNAGDVWALVDGATGVVLAHRVEAALDRASRNRGLLGRDGLDDTALILAPCSAVHTFFMRFPIDVAFVDRDGVVVKVTSNLRPWRVAGAWRAFAVCELASGTLGRAGTRRGSRLALRRH